MRKTITIAAAVLLVCAALAAAQDVEFTDTTIARFGYALPVPQVFSISGTASDTTAWTYLAESPAVPPDSADKAGGALTIWVNRMPVETMNLAGLYEIGRRYDADAAGSTGAAIRDLRDLTIDGGYGYWYKEADKSEPAANHRWIAKVFGNGAVYTFSVAGPFGSFDQWGPVFERVIAGFRLVPITGK